MPDSSVAVESTSAPVQERRGGRLDITFRRGADGSTLLGAQFASYPFHLCRPFRLDGDPRGMATLYLQSCSGGIYEGDRLEIRLATGLGALAHVTTQAACSARGMRAEGARARTALEAGPDSVLEYLPDPTILFPRARLRSELLVAADASARVIAAESVLLHDPDGAHRRFSHLSSLIQVNEAGSNTIQFRDRMSIPGEAWPGRDPGSVGAAALASVIVLDRHAAVLVTALRAALGSVPDLWAGASVLPDGIGAICKMLARDGHVLRSGVDAAWRAARRHWFGAEPPLRRK